MSLHPARQMVKHLSFYRTQSPGFRQLHDPFVNAKLELTKIAG
jgi:hypothetical protein